MRRFLKWALITLGIAALVRKLRSKRGVARDSAPDATVSTQTAVTVTTTTTTEDPADELRRKLADTREPEASEPAGSVDDRRAEVHDQGRSAIDEMRSSSGGE
jgi:hypothetical protein